MKKMTRIAAVWLLVSVGLCGCGAVADGMEEEISDPEQIEAASVQAEKDEAAPAQTEKGEAEPVQAEKDEAASGQTEKDETAPVRAEEDKVPGGADYEQLQSCQEAYKDFLADWKKIEDYGDFSYLEMYFGEDYYFDQYFLCDIDENGIPEFGLYSSYMQLTALFTYTDEPVYLLYDNIYGINPETDEVVIHGHWHGAGGSWVNEWSAYRIAGDKAEYSMYIDYLGTAEDGDEIHYTVYDEQSDEYTRPQDSVEYDAFYAAHVEPCVLMENYRFYDLSDLSGFDNIQ